MKSRGMRVLLVFVAAAALAAAGAGVWQTEQRLLSARSAADTFAREARQTVVALGDLRAAQQAYVANGQPTDAWIARAAELAAAVRPKISQLHAAAGTTEAQAVLESAIEAFAAFMQSDARAREYVKSGERLSASDVIFTEAGPTLEKAIVGIDTARGQEDVAHAIAVEGMRRLELIMLAAAAAVAVLAMVILVPIPRAGEPESGSEEVVISKAAAGLNLSLGLEDGVVRRARPLGEEDTSPASGQVGPGRPVPGAIPAASLKGPDLEAVADLCSSFARVQDTRELQGLLERTAKVLDASGVIVWMPDGPQGTLRPVLAHGYASLALSRMGVIHPASDNATATAYRTKRVVVVPAEGKASGAIIAPLTTSEGCSGAMAVELREDVEATPSVRAVAAILTAQLATLLVPAPVPATAGPPPAHAASAAAGGAPDGGTRKA